MIATEIITSKRNGGELSLEQIQFFINGYTSDKIPDYQMSALLMAIFINGMSEQETIDLTLTMLNSGVKIQFDSSLFPVDKHSTGGVGDKTSLILAPIVAACGVPVPMMSGRGLGHTGGTLDKLEAIPGFNVSLTLDVFKNQVEKLGLSFIGQTTHICPADKKIYALRDVTATVESLPLICASIMSKKIAEGIRGLILDVKTGSGAFMKTIEQSQSLAKNLIKIGKAHGIQTQALITDMNQPLGRFAGNALEIQECLSILKRSSFSHYKYTDFSDTENLSVELSAAMISLGLKISLDEARARALHALNSGLAFEKFAEACHRQGGDIERIPVATHSTAVTAPKSGVLQSINTEKVGLAGIVIGAGRRLVTDPILPEAGIEIHKKIGDSIHPGDSLFTIHSNKSKKGADEAFKILTDCYQLSSETLVRPPLIYDRLF